MQEPAVECLMQELQASLQQQAASFEPRSAEGNAVRETSRGSHRTLEEQQHTLKAPYNGSAQQEVSLHAETCKAIC